MQITKDRTWETPRLMITPSVRSSTICVCFDGAAADSQRAFFRYKSSPNCCQVWMTATSEAKCYACINELNILSLICTVLSPILSSVIIDELLECPRLRCPTEHGCYVLQRTGKCPYCKCGEYAAYFGRAVNFLHSVMPRHNKTQVSALWLQMLHESLRCKSKETSNDCNECFCTTHIYSSGSHKYCEQYIWARHPSKLQNRWRDKKLRKCKKNCYSGRTSI